jgi:hypothetical protein
MGEKKNLYERIREFIFWNWENIKENVAGIREAEDTKALFKCCIYALISAAVIIACAFVFFWLLKNVLSIVVSVMSFLNREENKAIGILIKGLVIIYAVALIINHFLRKDEPVKGELEIHIEKRKLQSDMLSALKGLASKHGLEPPDTISDMSNFLNETCEIEENIFIYIFSIEKDFTSERAFEKGRFKRSLVRRISKLEHDGLLTTSKPNGFITPDGESICSILIMDVIDNSDYIIIKVARADSESYSLYKRRANIESSTAPIDSDF